jgi:ABC-type nitrate/sulfonate/bicarbonate transport system substrate-binding protein
MLGGPFDTVAKLFYIFGWFGQCDWLAANTDTARALAGAFYDAARWGNAHRAESAVIESKYTKVGLTIVRSMGRNLMSASLNAAYIQPLLDMATRYKILDRPFTAAELIAPGFT